jgi:cell division transport system permease protein
MRDLKHVNKECLQNKELIKKCYLCISVISERQMAKNEDKITGYRLATSTVSTVISITLVLCVIGILGTVLINGKRISNNIRENLGFEVVLASDITEGEIADIKNMLAIQPYVQSLRFVSKEEATKETIALLGHDFTEVVGNIIPASFQIKINNQYASLESLQKIENSLCRIDKIADVNYQRDYVRQINENLYKITIILLSVSFLFLLISIALISSTIRLTIYAKRFIIRSMLLVGAKRSTIYFPFIAKCISQGLFSGCFACMLLGGALYGVYLQPRFSELIDFSMPQWYALLFGGIIATGVLITWLSSWLSVRRYIKIKTDKLYF